LNNSKPHENAAGHAQELLEFLAANRQSLSPLLILPHDYPDPDALAAAFALHFLARECYGIESRIVYRGVIGRTENQTVQRTFEVPVNYGPLPSTLTVANVEPAEVAVTLSGQRKAFAFLRPYDIKVVLQLWEARKGRHRFTTTSRDLSYPPGLELEGVQPGQVLLDIERKPPEAKNNH